MHHALREPVNACWAAIVRVAVASAAATKGSRRHVAARLHMHMLWSLAGCCTHHAVGGGQGQAVASPGNKWGHRRGAGSCAGKESESSCRAVVAARRCQALRQQEQRPHGLAEQERNANTTVSAHRLPIIITIADASSTATEGCEAWPASLFGKGRRTAVRAAVVRLTTRTDQKQAQQAQHA